MITETATLEEYIAEKKQVLKDFNVYRYCTAKEKAELRAATSKSHADRIGRTLIDRHFEEASQVDKLIVKKTDPAMLTEIGASTLSRKTKNMIMRHRIFTVKEFIDFVNKNGWNKIRGMGELSAREAFEYIYPEKSDKEIDGIIKKFKKVG